MSSHDVIGSFWSAMQANDWTRAASFLAPGCVVDWPCSGERIVGRDDFAAVQARYATNTGRWSFDVHRLVADDDTVVSEVTVTDGEQSARVIVFSQIVGDHIANQVEYWPIPYDPPAGREDLTRPAERIP
jgi:limonene-1,2-epoxide hydrolase